MTSRVFNDLKIIELASVLAGPAVGLFFAELGAQVTKVENKKTGGDVTRTWRLPSEDAQAPVSAYYCAVNWNKQVELLDLSEEKDRQKVYKWAKEADMIIANFKPNAAQKLGMDYEQFYQLNPQIIYGNISGFGDEHTRVAFDVVLQAESGFMYMNGQPESPPTKMPVALIDILAAHHLKEGLLVALIKRLKTGKGSYVTVSLFDAALASLANQATNWLMGEHIPQRMGSLHPNIAPYGEMFETQDKQKLVLAIGNDKQFITLCDFLDIPAVAQDPNYATNAQRVKHRETLKQVLSKAFAQQQAADLLQKCHKNAVPLGQVRNMQQVFEQKAAQDLILHEKVEKWDTQRVKTAIFQLYSKES